LADSEELPTKAILALERVFSTVHKCMPTGENYSEREHIAIEMVPDFIAAHKMLEKLQTLEPDERIAYVKEMLGVTLKENRWLIKEMEKGDLEVIRALTMVLCSHIFVTEAEIKDKDEKSFTQAFDRITKLQTQQLQEVIHYVAELLSSEHIDLNEELKKAFPFSYQPALQFEKTIQDVAAFFKAHPDWKEALKDENISRLQVIMKKGIPMEALDFMISQKGSSPKTAAMLLGTKELFEKINSITTLVGYEAACLDAVVDGKVPAVLAGSKENFGLAILLRDEAKRRNGPTPS
jgi:hypothetical protein